MNSSKKFKNALNGFLAPFSKRTSNLPVPLNTNLMQQTEEKSILACTTEYCVKIEVSDDKRKNEPVKDDLEIIKEIIAKQDEKKS